MPSWRYSTLAARPRGCVTDDCTGVAWAWNSGLSTLTRSAVTVSGALPRTPVTRTRSAIPICS